MESRSVINLVSPDMQSALLDASAKAPDLFGMDERDLFKKLRSQEMTPSPTDNRVRIQFWFEYEQAQAEHRKMKINAVYAGVCSHQYFYNQFLKRPEKVAWMMTPPTDYVTKVKEALDFGLDRMRDYLEIDPNTYPAGARIKLMELQAKITTMLDQREKGAYTQRVEQKNMNLHVSTSDKQVAAALAGSTMEQLDSRIKELERRERRALNLPVESGAKEEAIADAEIIEDSDG